MGKVAAALAAAALWPGVADAASPALLAVDVDERRPAAHWVLPPRVEARAVAVATLPDRLGDGAFVPTNEVLVDPVEPGATEWQAEEPLSPGRYYLLIVGFDASCLVAAGTCAPVYSNVLPFTVVNAAPRIAALAWTMRVHGPRGPRAYVTARARLRICDDAAGPVAVRITQSRVRGGRVRARSVHVDEVGFAAAGCRLVNLLWTVERRFLARGPYTVQMSVRDDEGASGNSVSRTWVD